MQGMDLRSQGNTLQGRAAATELGDRCHPALCALGAEPHAHCVCGLPMAMGADRCDLCRSEEFEPRPLRVADHEIEWDGQRYPSLRLNRPADVPAARYDDLLRAILGPVTKPTTAEEAA